MYVDKDGENLVLTGNEVFHRGALRGRNTRWIKIYQNAVRELYRAVHKSQHKHLGYVFKMLRHTNVQHNILCLNPMEKEREQIIPITFGQFCEMAGYSAKDTARLATYFMKVRFCIGNRKEAFCKFVMNDRQISRSWIFVNPRVMYSGTDPEAVANFSILSQCPDDDSHNIT